MARYRGPVCRLCRREGEKLFLKGARCLSDKCSYARKPTPPGRPSKRRPKDSEYGTQLREKQKVRRIYTVLETQFKNYFKKAKKMRGMTGRNLLSLLERRLDNVVYLLGWGESRAQSRQLIRHGCVLLNDRRVNIPSCLVEKDDKIILSNKKNVRLRIEEILKSTGQREAPAWIERLEGGFEARILRLPAREDIQMVIDEQKIVALYSK